MSFSIVEWREVFRVNPAYSLEHRRKVLPYKNPDDFECLVDGLRKAGLVAQCAAGSLLPGLALSDTAERSMTSVVRGGRQVVLRGHQDRC